MALRGHKSVHLNINMRHFFIALVAMTLSSATAFAQKITVTGQVVEKETAVSCISANVVLLNPKDSTQASGVTTDVNGQFRLPAVAAGNYILRISYMGFKTHTQNLTLAKKPTEITLGKIELAEDAKLMEEAVVSQNVAMVEQKEDTFVFNAAAYRVPPGSTLEALVKKLPGADVDDEGKITVNGKEVKKILVKGREFFSSNPQTAMQNIPVDMVDKIKAYDKQSDYSRMTGIDDGEEETVLDLTIKKNMEDGWRLDLDGAGGFGVYDNADNRKNYIGRYSGRANFQRYTDNSQLAIVASSNNTNDAGGMGGGMGGRFRGGNSGIRTSHEVGLNYNWWTSDKKEEEAGYLQWGGNARFRHTSNDNESKTNSETFLSTGKSTFANSMSASTPWNYSISTDWKLEWQIDSLTKMIFRPNYSFSRNHGMSNSTSVTFNENPYDTWSDPLSQYTDGRRDSILVNDNVRYTQSDSRTHSVNGSFQINRRLGQTKGRNITFDANAGYSTTQSESWNKSTIRYFQGAKQGITKQDKYNDNPSTNWNIRGRLSYTEPLSQYFNLQLSYSFQYRFSDSDRSQYERDSLRVNFLRNGYTEQQFEQMAGEWIMGVNPIYNDLFAQWAKDWENSQYATYRELNHDAGAMIRFTKGAVRFNAGVSFQPQTTHMDYKKNKLDTTVTRHVFNWAPRLMFQWKISKTSQLRLRYNGRMSQPSMTNLLDIYDTSDPLRITRGNPSLDPSFTHNANLFYNNFITDRQMGWMAHVNYSTTLNSISNASIYDQNTGATYSRPMNINGNWNINAFAGFNTALDSKKAFNMHIFGNVGYNENVGFETTSTDRITPGMPMDQIFAITSLNHSTTKSLNTGGRLNFTYRNDWIEVGPQGSINYRHATNKLQTRANMDTYDFGYGGNLQITFPWNMTFTTDITEQGRRGYNDASMNTNELVWNMQLSQTFLRNSLILSVKAYDILHQRSAISRALSATSRSDTWDKAINTFVMFHITYKLQNLGKHESKAAPEFDGPPMPPGEGPRSRGGNGGGGERRRPMGMTPAHPF